MKSVLINKIYLVTVAIILLSVNSLFAQSLFAPAVDYTSGNGPVSVFSIDFNSDGYNDLVSANFYSDNVSILLGNGDGTFQPAVNYTVGDRSISVFSLDFNGDSNNDLAVANYYDNNVSILLGNGDGTFQPAVNYSTGVNPISVFSNDFNSDGNNDLATANSGSDNVSILLGNGDGTFQSAVHYITGWSPHSVYSIDLDNDGNKDLTIANFSSSNVSILLGNGNGTFQSAVNYSTGVNPFSIFSIDFNGDSTNDLVVANFNSDNVSILLNNLTNPLLIENVLVENESLNLHILNHTPEISWSFTNPAYQTEVEIAVGTDNDWTSAEMWNSAPITSADTFITYNGSTLVDGETYYGRLKVSNGTAWSDWFEFSFRMNSKPTTPVTLSPKNDTITNSTPTLWIQNSVDSEGDSLFYDFSGNKFDGIGIIYEPLLVGDKIAEGIDSTGFVITTPLEENSLFLWEVRAYDGYEYSGWTTLLSSTFWVNDIDEAPSSFSALTPEESTSPLYNMQPTFSWTESIDNDPLDTVRYKLHLAIDSNFAFTTVIDSIAVNGYTLTFPLEYNEQYWWKVEAIDLLGVSTVSNVLHFWTSCCVGLRGNVDSDVLDQIDISDLVALVAYMFQGGADPLCMDEADVDGLGGIDISDLVLLVTYMFSGGVSPADCP